VDSGLIGVGTKGRLFAMAVDNLLATVISVLAATRMPEESGQARWVVVVATYLAYYWLQEGVWGTTLGKRLFGLRVVALDGSPLSWRLALVRTLTRLLEVNPVVLGVLPGGLMVAFTKRHQRLGDLLSGAVVVPRAQRPSNDELQRTRPAQAMEPRR
jgi:uncharacterized RDD family membrane protein YckC